MNLENLWAPWRGAYLRELDRQAQQLRNGDGEDGDADAGRNFLSEYWRAPERDEVNHVIHRGSHGLVLLNRYPYANGHLLVALGEPRPTLLDYDAEHRAAFWQLIETGLEMIQRVLRPQGVNVGINQGRAAGAGVPEHLHAHLVPRWHGDTNFISVVGRVRVIPEHLEEMARKFHEA